MVVKAARLEAEVLLAPALRTVSTRKVTIVDRHTGKPIREGIIGEVIEGLARAAQLEGEVSCPEEFCSNYPKCKKRTPSAAMKPSEVARRGSKSWTCRPCYVGKSKTLRVCVECGCRVSATTLTNARKLNKKPRCLKHRILKPANKLPQICCCICGTAVSRTSATKARRCRVDVFCFMHRNEGMKKRPRRVCLNCGAPGHFAKTCKRH